VGINIPGVFLFEGYLSRYGLGDWARSRYATLTKKASDCVECGVCETRCPYNLPIREMLKKVPLDRLMLVVKRSAQQSGKNFSFTVTDETSLVDKFNIFAAEKITEDADYDPLKAREAFIIKNCGEKAAPHIAAYFRLLERRTLFVFSTTGLLSAKNPLAKDFYDREFFDTLQKFLSDAVTASKDTPYAGVLEKEYAFFLKRRSGIELSMLNALPRFNAADANAGFQELTGILGDPVGKRSAVQCVLSPDKKFMILRMKADEPAMNKRRISGTGRDYPNAWRDDRSRVSLGVWKCGRNVNAHSTFVG
jgi:NAD-dependent dihydropyrimidine dehydrogenase PreA subunit